MGGLSNDQTIVLTTEIVAQAQWIAVLAQENDRLLKVLAANVERLKRQLWEKEEENKRVHAEMVSCAGRLEQQLAAQIQANIHVQDQALLELRTHQEAMRTSVRQQERREQALTQSYRDQLQQLRTEHWRNRYHPSASSMRIDDHVSELADQFSRLEFAEP